MKKFRSRAASSIATMAVVAMTATPVMARGHGDWHRHRHHRGNGIDGGDLIAGLLVIGGAVAIASAVSKKSSEPRNGDPASYRYPGGPVNGDGGYAEDSASADRVPDAARTSADLGRGVEEGSFDAAANACADELQRSDKQVQSVDNVRRMGERYSVEGRLEDGRAYACSIDDAGQIRSVAVDGRAVI